MMEPTKMENLKIAMENHFKLEKGFYVNVKNKNYHQKYNKLKQQTINHVEIIIDFINSNDNDVDTNELIYLYTKKQNIQQGTKCKREIAISKCFTCVGTRRM